MTANPARACYPSQAAMEVRVQRLHHGNEMRLTEWIEIVYAKQLTAIVPDFVMHRHWRFSFASLLPTYSAALIDPIFRLNKSPRTWNIVDMAFRYRSCSHHVGSEVYETCSGHRLIVAEAGHPELVERFLECSRCLREA